MEEEKKNAALGQQMGSYLRMLGSSYPSAFVNNIGPSTSRTQERPYCKHYNEEFDALAYAHKKWKTLD